jgi:hypothetical protein
VLPAVVACYHHVLDEVIAQTPGYQMRIYHELLVISVDLLAAHHV